MEVRHSEPKQIWANEAIRLVETSMEISLSLLHHVHNETADEKEMWSLYYSVRSKVIDLHEKKIVNLAEPYFLLSMVLPIAYRAGYLHRFNHHLDCLMNGEPFDLRDYTEVVLSLNNQSMLTMKKMQEMCKMIKTREMKKSALDELPCKSEIIEAFKQIRELETSTDGRKVKSPFADIYKEKIRPLLKDTPLFKAQNKTKDANDPELETPGEINHRVYKQMSKLYSGWKKKQGDIRRVIDYLESNLWNLDTTVEQVIENLNRVDDDNVDFLPKLVEMVREYTGNDTRD